MNLLEAIGTLVFTLYAAWPGVAVRSTPDPLADRSGLLHLADFDAEIPRADGRVDTAGTTRRLKEAAAEGWRPMEQPDLKAALENVPMLHPESLGEPARGVNVWERWLVPNKDGLVAWQIPRWSGADHC
jgi:hypothetical protein